MIEIVRAQNDIVVSSEDVFPKELGTLDSLIGLHSTGEFYIVQQMSNKGSGQQREDNETDG